MQNPTQCKQTTPSTPDARGTVAATVAPALEFGSDERIGGLV